MGFPIELVLGLGSLFFLLGLLLMLGWAVFNGAVEFWVWKEKKRTRKSSDKDITEELPTTN